MAIDPIYLPKTQEGTTQGTPSVPPGFGAALAPRQEGLAGQEESFFAGFGFPDVVEQEVGKIASFKRGFFQASSLLTNLVGDEELTATLKDSAALYPREFQTLTDVKDLSDLGTFAIESGFENLFNMLAIAAGAGLGTLAGGPIGGVAGGAAVAAPFAAGETKETIEAAGGTPTARDLAAGTVINTTLDTFGALRVFKAAGILNKGSKVLDKAAKTSGLSKKIIDRVKVAGGAAASSFAAEGATEVAQDYVNSVIAQMSVDKSFSEALGVSQEDIPKYVDTLFRGGFGGAFVAAPTAAILKEGNRHEEVGGANNESRAAPVQPTERPIPTPPKSKKPLVTEPIPTPDIEQLREAAVTPQFEVTDKTPRQIEDELLATKRDKEEDSTRLGVVKTPTKSDIAARVDEKKIDQEINEIALPVVEEQVIDEEQFNKEFKLQQTLREEQVIDPAIRSLGQIDDITFATFRPYDSQTRLQKTFKATEDSPLLQTTGQIFDEDINQEITSFMGDILKSTDTGVVLNIGLNVKQDMFRIAKEVKDAFLPNNNLLLTSMKELPSLIPNIKISNNTSGMHINVRDTVGKNFSVIALDIDTITNNIIASKKIDDNPITQDEVNAGVYTTLAHEMGHAIMWQTLKDAPDSTKAAVRKDYVKWLNGIKDMTWAEFIGSRFSKAGAIQIGGLKNGFKNKPALDVIKHLTREQSRYLLSFDEFGAEAIARIATNTQNKFWKDTLSKTSLAFFRKVIDTLKSLWNNVKQVNDNIPGFTQWLEEAVISRNTSLKEAVRNTPAEAIPVAIVEELDVSKEFFDEVMQDTFKTPDEIHIDHMKMLGVPQVVLNQSRKFFSIQKGFGRFSKFFLTPTQISERFGGQETQAYMNEVYAYARTKMQGIAQADSIADQWTKLPKQQANDYGKFVFAISEESDNLGRRLSTNEINILRKNFNITDDLFSLYEEMDQSFQSVLARLRNAVEQDIAATFVTDPTTFLAQFKQAVSPKDRMNVLTAHAPTDFIELQRQLDQANKQFVQFENKNYFPRSRFGPWSIRIVEQRGATSIVKEFMTFESRSERDSVLEDIEKRLLPNESAVASRLDDMQRSLVGMPQVVIDKIRRDLESIPGGLTPEQDIALKELDLQFSPGKRFLRHMQKRKNTKGFSQDALRTYASYMANASNHMARIEHARNMIAELDALRDLSRQQPAPGEVIDVTEVAELSQYYQEHFKYLMNPENDWAALRSAGFMWYLGFNVKSALVNLTQIPVVTYPYLAAKYGDAKAVKALSSAYGRVSNHYLKRKGLPQDEQRVLDRMLQDGLIDESFATNLAGIAEGGMLGRLNASSEAGRRMNELSYYGAYMFQASEKYNRRVTALASFRLAFEQTGNFEDAYAQATDSVRTTQFEYGKWDRPEFTRGRKSALFLFFSYTQQFLYLALGGRGNQEGRRTALRMWATLLVLAGLQGLPGAEYILSLIDFFGTGIMRTLGLEDPKVDSRRAIREFVGPIIDDLTLGMIDNPDFLMHGISREYGLGPLHALELAGIPVPNLDLSGSLGMGTFLPFDVPQGDRTDLGDMLLSGLGPLANIGTGMYDSINSTDPDTWKRIERAMPSALKNFSRATRIATRGAETSRGAAKFLEFDAALPDEAAELIAWGLGFSPTRVTRKHEIFGEQSSTALYWQTRRQMLLERHAYHMVMDDKRARRETAQDITKFNRSLQDKELRSFRISNIDIRRSMRQRLRMVRLRERGIPVSTRQRLVYRGVAESFGPEESL